MTENLVQIERDLAVLLLKDLTAVCLERIYWEHLVSGPDDYGGDLIQVMRAEEFLRKIGEAVIKRSKEAPDG